MKRKSTFAWTMSLLAVLFVVSALFFTRMKNSTETIELASTEPRHSEASDEEKQSLNAKSETPKTHLTPTGTNNLGPQNPPQNTDSGTARLNAQDSMQEKQRSTVFKWIAKSGYRPIIQLYKTEGSNKNKPSEWLGDSLIISTSDAETNETLISELKTLGVIATRNLGSPTLWEVTISAQSAEEYLETMERVRTSKKIASVGPDDIMSLNQATNDPLLPLQYAIGGQKTSAIVRSKFEPAEIAPLLAINPDANLKADISWPLKRDCSAIKIGVIDSGVDANHPDLKGNLNLALSRNFATQQTLTQPDCKKKEFLSTEPNTVDSGLITDQNGHGTHVAGTIGAVANNGIGVAGVCWKAEIIVLRSMNRCGVGRRSEILSAIKYAESIDVKVLNMSLSGTLTAADKLPTSPSYSTVDSFGKKGGIIVSAAGNEAVDVSLEEYSQFPGTLDLPNIINVGSISANNQVSLYSNFGLKYVHISAPGDMVMSTFPNNLIQRNLALLKPNENNPNFSVLPIFRQTLINMPAQGYEFMSGTSMAAPHVAGAVALVWSLDPSRSSGDIRRLLLDTSDELPTLASKIEKGRRLNLFRALKASMGYSLDVTAPMGDTKTDVSVSRGSSVLVRLTDPANAPLQNAMLFLGSTQIGICSEVDGNCVGRIPKDFVSSADGKSQPLSIKGPTNQIAAGSIRVLSLSTTNGVFKEDSISRSCRVLASGKNYATFTTPSLSVCKNMCRMLLVGTRKADGVCEFGDQFESIKLESCSIGGE